MKLFCKHEARVLSRTYAPPLGIAFECMSFDGGYRADRLLHGWTTTLVTCDKCGKVWEFSMVGKVTDAKA